MLSCKRFRWVGLLALGWTIGAWSATATVQQVVIKGSHRLPSATVRTYLPIHRGDRPTDAQLNDAVRRMYRTGLFHDVRLTLDGHVLNVWVQEQPMISSFKWTGLDHAQRTRAMVMMRHARCSVGQVWSPQRCHQAVASWENILKNEGYYQPNVNVTPEPSGDGRVAVHINATSGTRARVKALTFVGNHAFSSDVLRDHVTVRPRLWSFLTHNNQYSQQGMERDRQALLTFYMNHGYLEASVVPQPPVWSKQHQGLTVTYRVHEGPRFRVGKVHVTPAHAWTDDVVRDAIRLTSGQVFSRERLWSSMAKLEKALADRGYAHNHVVPRFQIHRAQKVVDITLHGQKGHQVMVRRIVFQGAHTTMDRTLRRAMRQYEMSVYSEARVRQSERLLMNLGFIKHAQCRLVPVGHQTTVSDLSCTVEDMSSTTLSGNLGYSSQVGFLYQLGVTEGNFLGLGHALSLNFQHDEMSEDYDVSYRYPDLWGKQVAMTTHLFKRRTTPNRLYITHYKTNDYGAGLDFSLPLDNEHHLLLGFAAQHTYLHDFSDAGQTVQAFVNDHGDTFEQYILHLGWRLNSLDRSIFPTHGTDQTFHLRVGVPLSSRALSYYTATYDMLWYHPMPRDWLLNTHVAMSYGRGYGKTGSTLPFFKNFFAGGLGSLPGYRTNSLGPKDSNGRAIGGNVRVTGSVNLITPSLLGEHVRTALFLAAGAVANEGLSANDLRYTAGVEAQWFSPLAPLVVSLGFPLKRHTGDHTQLFGITLSTSW